MPYEKLKNNTLVVCVSIFKITSNEVAKNK